MCSLCEIQAGSHLKNVADIKGAIKFPVGAKSLLSKYLTTDVSKKYLGRKDAMEVPFELMILAGCSNVDTAIGIQAGSQDSYSDFSDIFDPIIEDYHQYPKDGTHARNLDYTQLRCAPLNSDDAKYIVQTRIRVCRNLANYPLGIAITKE